VTGSLAGGAASSANQAIGIAKSRSNGVGPISIQSMDIDRSIDALIDVLEAANVERPRAPADLEVLEQIATAIAPRRLPGDLRRFWERIDPRTLRVDVFPTLCEPEFALQSWQREREEFPQLPAILFLAGYESWSCMSVELDGVDSVGGALFQWSLEDGDFHLGYHGLGDWLARIAELVRAGSYERQAHEDGSVSLQIADEWDEIRSAALRAGGSIHPIYGEATAVPRDPLDWPAHWQRAADIESSDIAARGATATIAELLASDPASEQRATIAGRVLSLAGGADVSVRVSDGTETITVLCPAAVTTFGPIVGESFEFDVVVPPGPRRRSSEAKVESADPRDAVEALTASPLSRYGGPIGATATAVRPCERQADR
jgi:hypothetical protein